MDCQMPGMDGLEATRLIRTKLQGRPLPIVALTANAMNADRDACVLAGMDDFLAKPVRQEELQSCLERWIATDSVVCSEWRKRLTHSLKVCSPPHLRVRDELNFSRAICSRAANYSTECQVHPGILRSCAGRW